MLQMQQISFLLVDLNLYLDMHPECELAIQDHNELSKQLCQLRSVYEAKHGPLMNFGLTAAGHCWQWVDECSPWPWENKRR
jgi:spore coat protein JB